MSEFTPKMDGIVEAEIERTTGPWREAWRSFRKNKVAVVGMIIVLFFVCSPLFGPLIAKEGINEQLHAGPAPTSFCRILAWNG